MNVFFRFVTDYPRAIIAAILGFTILFASQIPRLQISADISDWIPEGHPASIYSEKMEEEFGIVDPVVVGILNDGPEGIFNSRTLELISEITEEIEALDGVVQGDTIGLASSKNIRSTAGGLEVEPFMEIVPETAEEIDTLRRAVFENEMFIGNIVSRDGRAALILVKFEEERDKKQIYLDVEAIVKRHRINGPEEIFFTGRPVMEGFIGIDVPRDIKRMLPVVALVVVLVLYSTFRCVRGVLLPLMVVGASAVWALGIMAIAKVPLYLIATWIPIILIAIGCAYGIHILNRYFEGMGEKEGSTDAKEIVRAAMSNIWRPVAMASLTTAAGFLSLVTVAVRPIRAVGVFTSIGIVCALLFSFTFLPAALSMMKPRRIGPIDFLRDSDKTATGLLGRILGAGGEFVCRLRVPLIAAAMLVSLLSIAFLPRLHIDDGLVLNLPPENELLKAHYFLNDMMGGSTVLSIVVDGKKPGAMKEPEMLRRLDELQRYAERQEEVGETISLAEYVKRMHLVMNENEEEFHAIPDSRDLVAQYLLLYSMSGDPGDFDEVVDYDYRKSCVKIQLKRDNALSIKRFMNKMEPFLQETFGASGIEAVSTGYSTVIVVVVDLVISGLLTSLLTALIIIFLITASMFRSPFIGLINLIPVVVATLASFGILSALGIRLGIATAMNSCIGIGIGIDYTIHFMARYREMLKVRPEPRWAIAQTMSSSGKAILFNALVVALGFLVLLFSVTPPNQSLGLLVALNMVTSFLGAMTILPAVLTFIPPERIIAEAGLFRLRRMCYSITDFCALPFLTRLTDWSVRQSRKISLGGTAGIAKMWRRIVG